MGHYEVDATTPWPADADGLFVDPAVPGAVVLILHGRAYKWPWQHAAAFAIDLATMAGRAACRTDATWEEIAAALNQQVDR